MILTVTLNASIDKRYVISGLAIGGVNRLEEAVYSAGGKGLNVARVARLAGASVTATGFVGGYAGVFKTRVPQLQTVNSVGCGDAMIAGFALGMERRMAPEAALKLASAISAANALQAKTGWIDRNDVEQLMSEIDIIRID